MLTIDDLPDDVLLEIFDFCVFKYQDLGFPQLNEFGTMIKKRDKIESWQSLVHVSRRWRCLVFGSPRRLSLQIRCFTPGLSARKTFPVDVWPALPILIEGDVSEWSAHDVIAKLEHSDRIRQIDLDFFKPTTSQLENLWAAMQIPFPELAGLYLSFGDSQYGPTLPDSFLGGSAPHLRYFYLHGIPFPGLPKLLLSATHLVELRLKDIPHFGYISPEAMVSCLSTNLERLQLEFDPRYPPQSHPDLKTRRPFPPTRSVLPALTKFSFRGVSDYLQEFVARIDAPQLCRLSIIFHDNDFKAPDLNQFIGRTPTLGQYDEACLIFLQHEVLVRLCQSHPERPCRRMVEVKLLCTTPRQQLSSISSLAQICTVSLRPLLTMENLYILGKCSPLITIWGDNTIWLRLLFPFTAVKNLYVCYKFTQRTAYALQELTERRTTEVLPALQNVFLEEYHEWEPAGKVIARFISARQLINRPVVISDWYESWQWLDRL